MCGRKEQTMFTVWIREKGGEERVLTFDREEVSIGRGKNNDVVLPRGNISKRHARIVHKDEKFIVVDLRSTNGTYFNARKITSPVIVSPQDRIYVGDFVLRVSAGQPDEASAAEGQEPAPAEGGGRKPTAPPPFVPEAHEEQKAQAPTSSMRPQKAPTPSRVDSQIEDIIRNLHPGVEEPKVAGPPSPPPQTAPPAPPAGPPEAPRPAAPAAPAPPAAPAQPSVAGPVARPRRATYLSKDDQTALGPVMKLIEKKGLERLVLAGFDSIQAFGADGRLSVKEKLAAPKYREALNTILAHIGFTDSSNGYAEGCILPGVEARAYGPPLTSSDVVLQIDRTNEAAPTLDDLQKAGLVDKSQATQLKKAVGAGASVLVVGANAYTRRKLLGALLNAANGDALVALVEERPLLLPARDGVLSFRLSATADAESTLAVLRRLGADTLVWLDLPATPAELPYGFFGSAADVAAQTLVSTAGRSFAHFLERTGLIGEEAVAHQFDLVAELGADDGGDERLVALARPGKEELAGDPPEDDED